MTLTQSLPQDARSSIRDQIASLTPEQRTAFNDNLAQLDLSSMDQDQLVASVQNMLNQFNTATTTADATSVSAIENPNSTFSMLV